MVMRKKVIQGSTLVMVLLLVGCGTTNTSSTIDYYDIVREYAEDYDYYPIEHIYENPGDFGLIREEDISEYASDYDYISIDEAQDYVLQNVAYDLIDENEFDALTTLRKMYGDVSVFGDYVLDVQNNIVHATSDLCSSQIKSDNIKEYAMYVGEGLEDNSAELCLKCIPSYVEPQYYGNKKDYKNLGITASNELLTKENGSTN